MGRAEGERFIEGALGGCWMRRGGAEDGRCPSYKNIFEFWSYLVFG